MLASTVFSSRKKPAALLAFAVHKVMRNESIEGKDILKAFFPLGQYESDSSIARTTAFDMRKRVDRYYNTIGKDDPVIIQFPKDPEAARKKRTANYRPTFSYHPNHGLHRTYLIAIEHLRQKRPPALDRGFQLLLEVLAKQPDHAAANIAAAEALLLGRHILQHDMDAPFEAGVYARRAVQAVPRNWRAHGALAAAQLVVEFDAAGASESFETSLNLNLHETQRYCWYHAFLFAMCRCEEGMELAKVWAEENPSDPYAQSMYGLWLYGNADVYEANQKFCDAYQIDRNCWLALLGSALADISLGNPKIAANKIHAFERPFDDFSWWADGLKLVCARYENLSAAYGWQPGDGSIAYFSDSRLTDDTSAATFAKYTEPASASLQGALNFMAQLKFDRALDFLEEAHERREPLMLWIHLMLVFTPLLETERFNSLLCRPLNPLLASDESSNSV